MSLIFFLQKYWANKRSSFPLKNNKKKNIKLSLDMRAEPEGPRILAPFFFKKKAHTLGLLFVFFILFYIWIKKLIKKIESN
jgi:hypothetical protein